MVSDERVPSWGSVIGATLLIGGTCIGGGMLAMPVATGVTGFVPSLLMMLLCWFMMTLTGLLYVEVSLWMKEGSHIISMAQHMLGGWGKAAAWILYLFISYASIVAYAAGVGDQTASVIAYLTGMEISANLGSLIFVLVFTSAVFFGSQMVGRLNSLLFLAMIAAFFMLVGLGIPEINLDYLGYRQWTGVGLTIPLLLTSFSVQAIVPSMTPYLKSHRSSLRFAIIGGTTVALLVYLVWQALVLGTVPVEGELGLKKAFAEGVPATEFLREAIGSSLVSSIAEYFAFFALVTSFLGMTLGLYDFLSDGLGISKEGWGKLILGALIIIPTYFFATNYARVFLVALDTSGGFGDAILNGVMPVMMVWIGRYHRKLEGAPLVPGGRIMLVVVCVFFLSALALEVGEYLGVLGMNSQIGTVD